MSKLYNKYFNDKDYFDGMAELLYDISENCISKEDVKTLANELVKKGKIQEDVGFTKKEPKKWNKRYVELLKHQMSVGEVGRNYLEFYAEVADTVAKKGKRRQIIGICSAIVAVIVVIAIIVRIYGCSDK